MAFRIGRGCYYSLVQNLKCHDKLFPTALYTSRAGRSVKLSGPSKRNERKWSYQNLRGFGLGVGFLLSATAYQVNQLKKDDTPTPSPCEEQHKIVIERSRKLLQRIMDEKGIPGLCVAVSVNGKTIWSEGLGYSDVENRVQCTEETVMRIASVSKSFTACAIAKLVEEGKLDLDKPVQEYVPEFPLKTYNGEKATITTRHLVHCLSGIRHFNQINLKDNTIISVENKRDSSDSQSSTEIEKKPPDYIYQEIFCAQHFSNLTDALNIFKDDPLVHKPGSNFLYSTYGWVLAGVVIERVSKQDYLTYMSKMFDEMDLKNTFADRPENVIFNRSRYYNKDGEVLQNCRYVDLSCKWPAGGFLSTVGDLLKFGNTLLYSYQQTENTGYLPQKRVESLWSCAENTKCYWDERGCYGMGWGIVHHEQPTPGLPSHQEPFCVSHVGLLVGSSNVLLILPERGDNELPTQTEKLPKGTAVAILANLASVEFLLYDTALELAQEFENAFS